MIASDLDDPAMFRASLLAVSPRLRDGWLDRVLGLGELPDDGPALPRGCTPYIPCSVDALLRMVDEALITASDVVVDIGSGVGRAATFLHLLTGARTIGLEIQPALVAAARELANRLDASRISYVEGDATELSEHLATGSVFFLYCPFSDRRLAKVLTDLEAIAHSRPIRICCVDIPLPACPWLVLDPQRSPDLAIYRSV